jgi:hypothetical protein
MKNNISNDNAIKIIEKKWYKSLKENNPDYSVYCEPEYIAELWACWRLYTRIYLKSFTKKNSFNKEKSIVEYVKDVPAVIDLGCGFGLSSIALSQMFSKKVYCTNLKKSFQYEIVQTFEKNHNLILAEDYCNFPKNSLIFASEYFEHFQRPTEHLYHVIKTLKPKFLLIANTFNGDAIGHFNEYFHLDKKLTCKQMNTFFGKCMRLFGYKKLKTNLWNNRPTLWAKIK